jgi:phage-related minor tail protein
MKPLTFALALGLALAATACKKSEETAEVPATEKTTTEKIKESATGVVESAKEAAGDVKDATKTSLEATKQAIRDRIKQLETQVKELDTEASTHARAVQTATDEVARKAAQEALDKVSQAKTAAQKKLDDARAEEAK